MWGIEHGELSSHVLNPVLILVLEIIGMQSADSSTKHIGHDGPVHKVGQFDWRLVSLEGQFH